MKWTTNVCRDRTVALLLALELFSHLQTAMHKTFNNKTQLNFIQRWIEAIDIFYSEVFFRSEIFKINSRKKLPLLSLYFSLFFVLFVWTFIGFGDLLKTQADCQINFLISSYLVLKIHNLDSAYSITLKLKPKSKPKSNAIQWTDYIYEFSGKKTFLFHFFHF